MEITAAKESVIRAGLILVEQGLVSRTWGNVSCRIDENRFAITPSGMGYDRLTADDIVVVDLQTLAYAGSVKPSSEKGIHAAAYRLRSDVQFVIHTHQTYATAMSLPGLGSVSMEEAERTALGGSVSRAGYGLPGSKRLWHNVEEVIAHGANAVFMERHGALLLGGSMEEAFARAALLEQICLRAVPSIPTVTAACANEAAQAQHWEQECLTELRRLLPQDNTVILRHAPVFSQLNNEARLPAMIDDFAQMAGRFAKIITPLPGDAKHSARLAAQALRGHGCVLLRGIGAVCAAKTPEDAEAVAQLAEKNAITYYTAKAHGAAVPLPLFDAVAMRAVYQLKYSKKK